MPTSDSNRSLLGDSPIVRLPGHTQKLAGLAWCPTGGWRVLTWSFDRTVLLWDAATASILQTFPPHNNAVECAALSPDGEWMASSSAGDGIRVCDVATGQVRWRPGQPRAIVRSLAWAPTGLQLAWAADETIVYWDVLVAEPREISPRHPTGIIYSVAWSPDGQTLAVGCGNRTVRFWDVQDGWTRQRCEGHRDEVRSVAWSPDGQWLASGSAVNDPSTRIWKVDSDLWSRSTPPHPRVLGGHTVSVVAASFSVDGILLASQSSGAIYFWRCDTWQAIWRLPIGRSQYPGLAFHPTARLVATHGLDERSVSIWQIQGNALPGGGLGGTQAQPRPPVRYTRPPAPLAPAEPRMEQPVVDPATAMLRAKQAAGAFDVFLSYSAKDKRWVRKWLIPRLEQQGIYCYEDDRHATPGVPKLVNRERALERCSKTLLILTPDWLMNEIANFEALLTQTRDPAGIRQRTIPLLLKSCPSLPQRLFMLTPVDLTGSPRDRKEQMDRLVKTINNSSPQL